jgi:hypothetical protein
VVERRLAKANVAGSNPVFRSTIIKLFKVTEPVCGCSSVVESQPSKLVAWVRFPSPAPCAPIAQLDRVLDFGSRCRRFESYWAYQRA